MSNQARIFQLTATIVLLLAGFVGAFARGPSRTVEPNDYDLVAPATAPGQTATLLPDGNWLLLGGVRDGLASNEAVILATATGKRTTLKNHLAQARGWHSATVLPDGTVFVFGGVGADGKDSSSVERFDPDTAAFSMNADVGLSARSHHTATLLADGSVLIVGGTIMSDAVVFDPATGLLVHAKPLTVGINASSALLADGSVLIWGGFDANGDKIAEATSFVASKRTFRAIHSYGPPTLPESPALALPAVVASSPLNGATDVAVDARLSVRFAKYLDVASINAGSVILFGPAGKVAARVVATNGGEQLFVTPDAELVPDAHYTLFLEGLTDGVNVLPFTAIDFKTMAIAPDISRSTSLPGHGTSSANAPALAEPADDVHWIPGARQLKGQWTVAETDSPWIHQTPLHAGPGVTALAGQVLTLNGQPLPNTTLSIGARSARTDTTGRFLLTGIGGGAQVLTIDGQTANHAGATYGFYQAKVDVAAGRTTALDYTIWMTALDTRNVIEIPSPTTTDIVVTNPRIPDLELRIPAGTVIRGLDGKIVTRISITAIPVNRPPFPLPPIHVPVYFTIQPGGAMLQGISALTAKGARLIYPNFDHQPPGSKVNFWDYDAHDKGWYVYGQGTISANDSQAVPDPGVVIYEFSGAMIDGNGIGKPQEGKNTGDTPQGGEPVDLATGLFTYRQTDLYLPDVIPIAVIRSYNGGDGSVRTFGLNTNFDYGMFLYSAQQYSQADLFLPDGSDVHYVATNCVSWPTNCPSWTNVIFQAQGTRTKFYLSTIVWNGNGWNLTLQDGTTYVWGANTQELLAIRDRHGNQVTLTRQSGQSGNITSVTSPNGRSITFGYTNAACSSCITSATDSAGRTVTYTYDTNKRLSTVTDANGGITTYAYDSNNRIHAITDPKGNTYLTNTYNTYGQVTQQVAADGHSIYNFAYLPTTGGLATQTTITDPNNNVRVMTFNANGDPLSDTRAYGTPLAETLSYTYVTGTNPNLVKAITDSLNRTTAYTYDGAGNVASITYLSGTPNAVTWNYTYEPAFQQMKTVKDPLGHVTTLSYNTLGELASIADPLGNTTTFAYDSEARVTSITDALKHAVTYKYLGPDLVSITNGLGKITTRFADAAGRAISVTDPMGNATRYTYDNNNDLLSVTNPLTGKIALTYDLDNTLNTVTSPNAGTTIYGYNGLGQLTSRTDPLGHKDAYLHDGLGNLTSATDRNGQLTTYSYDALNRLSIVTYSDGSTLNIGYDSGNRAITLTDSLNGTITRNYDGLDQLKQEMSEQGTVQYLYDSANRRTSMTAGAAAQVIYGYDNANRLTSVTQGSAAVTLGYDNANRLSTLTLPNGVVATYGYDNGNELTSLSYALGAATLDQMNYTYDAAGRDTTFVSTGNQLSGLVAPVSTGSYGLDDALKSYGSVATFSFDANGNLLGDGTNTYTWNARNQLIAITGAVTASFSYDAMGRRTARSVGGTSTSFLHEDANLVQEAGGGNSVSYLTGPGLDQVFSRTDSSGTMSYLRDGLGSVFALADVSGNLATQYAYDPYGNTATMGATSANPLQYAGRENDGTGLYYSRARYYSPALGRFISQDPIGFGGGINRYAYVRGNPIQSIDPSGLLSSGLVGSVYNPVGISGSIGPFYGGVDISGQGTVTVSGGLQYPPSSGNPLFGLSPKLFSLSPEPDPGLSLTSGVKGGFVSQTCTAGGSCTFAPSPGLSTGLKVGGSYAFGPKDADPPSQGGGNKKPGAADPEPGTDAGGSAMPPTGDGSCDMYTPESCNP
jgi:RHS repeat-associated protein